MVKKKYKKGFTLVELLSIIVILSMIIVIGVPTYQSSSKKAKEKMYRTKLDNANQSGKLWAIDNMECFKTNSCTDKITPIECDQEGFGANDSCYSISLKTLAKEGYYKFDDNNENIINPIDKSLMNDVQIVLVYNSNSKKVGNHPLKNYLLTVVTFPSSLQRNQNKTITINNLYEIDSVKTDTGSVSYNRNKDNITLNVSKGSPTSTQWNSKLYDKTATANNTSSTNSFDSTYSYNDGDYSGTLNKSGSSSVISGVYTPEDTKYVSGQTSSNYNSGGYSGTLSLYLYSGSYTPSDSKTVTQNSGSYTWGHYLCSTGVCYKSQSSAKPSTSSKSYNSGGYSGTLYYSEWSGTHPDSPKSVPNEPLYGSYAGGYIYRYLNNYEWSGTVTRPASDTRVYRYGGYVTRPASDTRVWQQNYSGTVYKGGYENLYSYKVTIAYNLKQ